MHVSTEVPRDKLPKVVRTPNPMGGGGDKDKRLISSSSAWTTQETLLQRKPATKTTKTESSSFPESMNREEHQKL